MSYIGNQPQYTSFLTDSFSGNGVTTVFTLRIAPANTSAVIIGISGVLQSPNDYAVVGNILTFSSPPPTGTNNISVRYLSLPASNVVNSAYRSVTDITATAGQTTFSTGSYTPGFVEVFRNGVRLGVSNYTATSGATVILGNPANANDLITVVSFFVSSVLNAIPGTSGAVTANFLDASQQGGAGAMIVPTGSTGQRPISPSFGMLRMNTTTGLVEFWDPASSRWLGISTVIPAELLLIGGGGGGAGSEGGGGGAGGLIYDPSFTLNAGVSYAVTVGTGGTGNTNPGGDGNSSIFGNLTASGGGGGGSVNSNNARAGGSGGGGGRTSSVRTTGGLGAPPQGNNGGTGFENVAGFAAAGGGGALRAGGDGVGLVGGAGGSGRQISITGTATFYAGGGGAGGGNNNGNPSAGAGGAGGGGAGGPNAGGPGNATAGTANTGGGGGGGGQGNAGANGGSGVVIIRVPSSVTATFSVGLTSSLSTAVSGFNIYTVTAGTGTATFS
jgi:hypothetical protein